MNNFADRWRMLAERARTAETPGVTIPEGFAGRVLARRRLSRDDAREEIWGRLTLRALAGAVAILLICAMVEVPHLRDAPSMESAVENTVAQILWRL